jgi:hypothetical protein
MQGRAIHFFTFNTAASSNLEQYSISTVVLAARGNNARAGKGTTGDTRRIAVTERTVPKAEIGADGRVGHYTAEMAIRYNRWFRKTGFKVS